MFIITVCMQNNTPKKNGSVNGVKGTGSPDVARKIDLRLEAKLSAEVSVRFVGVLVKKIDFFGDLCFSKIFMRFYVVELATFIMSYDFEFV